MYVLIVYDVAVERGTKVYKKLKQYLHWRQNSVFEGELTEAKVEKLKAELEKLVVKENDLILLYIARDEKWLKRETIGKILNTTDNVL